MAGTAWYDIPLQCPRCGSVTAGRQTGLQSPALNLHVDDLWLKSGHLLLIGLEDLADAFRPGPLWPPADTVRALEVWECPACLTSQAALLCFGHAGAAGWRVLGAEGTKLTPEVLASVHGASAALRDILTEDQTAQLGRP